MSQTDETHFGIKCLTASNWQQPDEDTLQLLKMTAVAKNDEEWLKVFLQPTLGPKVPDEIVKLIEVARGALIYSWYFKPLATLGAEQCWRIMETGARIRCRQAGISTTRTIKTGKLKGTFRENSFSENIEALLKQGAISSLDESRWDAVRNLRNIASHPERQMILDSWQVLGIFETCSDFLNGLFQ